MTKEFVTLRGKKHKMRRMSKNAPFYFEKYNCSLSLENQGITDIDEIKGLENLTGLKTLWLDGNQLEEIKGLENLTNLKWLNLSKNQIKEIKGLETLTKLLELKLYNNQIVEIKGLENLTNLKKLDLSGNPIKPDERYLIYRGWKNPQAIVKYCQEKTRKKKIKQIFSKEMLSMEDVIKFYTHDDMVNAYFIIRKANNPMLDIRMEELFDFYGWKGSIDIVEFGINTETEEKRLTVNEFKTETPESVGELIRQIKKYRTYYPKYLRREGDTTVYEIKTRLFFLDPLNKNTKDFIDMWFDALKNEDIEVFLLNIQKNEFYPFEKLAK